MMRSLLVLCFCMLPTGSGLQMRPSRRQLLRQTSAGAMMLNLPFSLPSMGAAKVAATNEVVKVVDGIRRKRLGGSDIFVSEAGDEGTSIVTGSHQAS